MSKSLKIYNPYFGNKELKAIKMVFKTGVLTQGAEVEELEKEFADYVGSKYAVAVNSCTSALFLSLLYKKEKGIKSITIPSVTFVSVANMILNAGLKLQFEDKIYVGESYNLKYSGIIDSAHELERNCYKFKKGSLMCFSFYPTKLLASCEGGMIACDKKEEYQWLKEMSNNGMIRKGFSYNYNVKKIGWKMNMNDIQAAILRVRLKKLDDLNCKRLEIRDLYNEVFGLEKISLHIYNLILSNEKKRRKIIKEFKDNGIGYSIHFKPIHLQEAYQKYRTNKFILSEYYYQHTLSIPLHENLSLNEAKFICKIIKKYEN